MLSDGCGFGVSTRGNVNEDLKQMGLDGKDAKSVAGNRTSGGLSSRSVPKGTGKKSRG